MDAGQQQDAITSDFNDNYQPVSKESTRNEELAKKRKVARKLFETPKSQSSYCEEVEGTHEAAGLHKILAKEPLQTIQTIRSESGVYKQNGKDTLEKLYGILSQDQ
ncbi:hypothetical protein JTB14_033445 [Gonioctena quinquepunctata]|nr:hypothetical protein JTB14_033445 [Gonioctena quinquepunctata]